MASPRDDFVDLVLLASRGDNDAFAALVGRVLPASTATARLILGDWAEADDALQDAFVRAWRALPSLRDPASFTAWIRRMVVNECLDRARARERWWRLHRQAEVVRAIDPADAVATTDELDRAFARLRARERAVLVLRYYIGLGPDQIAAAMGIGGSTARSRVHYALGALRAALEAEARSTYKEEQTWSK